VLCGSYNPEVVNPTGWTCKLPTDLIPYTRERFTEVDDERLSEASLRSELSTTPSNGGKTGVTNDKVDLIVTRNGYKGVVKK
jgi:hypothetical protein